MKYLFLIMAVALLPMAGCEERYRYPCQDPQNWETQMCQKPFCTANGTCPEDLRHYIKDKNDVNIPAPASKGDCK